MVALSCCLAVLKTWEQEPATSWGAGKLRCQWGWQIWRDLSQGLTGPPWLFPWRHSQKQYQLFNLEMPSRSSPSPAHPQHPSLMVRQRFTEQDWMLPHPATPWTACGCSTKPQQSPSRLPEWLPDPSPLLWGCPPWHRAPLQASAAAAFPVGARISSSSPPGYGVAKQP